MRVFEAGEGRLNEGEDRKEGRAEREEIRDRSVQCVPRRKKATAYPKFTTESKKLQIGVTTLFEFPSFQTHSSASRALIPSYYTLHEVLRSDRRS